jgi:hypothetical protein
MPLVRDVHQHPSQELERVGRLGARRRALRLVGPVRHGLGGPVVRQPFERHGIPRTVPGEPSGKRAVLLRHPHGGVHVEPRVRPCEHARCLVLVEQLQPHEQPQHGAAKRLGQPGGVLHWPRHECPIRPKAAVRDEEMQMRMPVCPRAVRLQAGDDPHGEVALAGQRANGGGTDSRRAAAWEW